jgi:hypothetical protein
MGCKVNDTQAQARMLLLQYRKEIDQAIEVTSLNNYYIWSIATKTTPICLFGVFLHQHLNQFQFFFFLPSVRILFFPLVRLNLEATVGEFRKTCHPRNVEVN